MLELCVRVFGGEGEAVAAAQALTRFCMEHAARARVVTSRAAS